MPSRNRRPSAAMDISFGTGSDSSAPGVPVLAQYQQRPRQSVGGKLSQLQTWPTRAHADPGRRGFAGRREPRGVVGGSKWWRSAQASGQHAMDEVYAAKKPWVSLQGRVLGRDGVGVRYQESGMRNVPTTHSHAREPPGWQGSQSLGWGLRNRTTRFGRGVADRDLSARERAHNSGFRRQASVIRAALGRSRPSRRLWLATSLQPGSEGENVSNEHSALSTRRWMAAFSQSQRIGGRER